MKFVMLMLVTIAICCPVGYAIGRSIPRPWSIVLSVAAGVFIGAGVNAVFSS